MKSSRVRRFRRRRTKWNRFGCDASSLFSGCHNKMMVMLDTKSGKVMGSVPIGSGVDGCAFDNATQVAFRLAERHDDDRERTSP